MESRRLNMLKARVIICKLLKPAELCDLFTMVF